MSNEIENMDANTETTETTENTGNAAALAAIGIGTVTLARLPTTLTPTGAKVSGVIKGSMLARTRVTAPKSWDKRFDELLAPNYDKDEFYMFVAEGSAEEINKLRSQMTRCSKETGKKFVTRNTPGTQPRIAGEWTAGNPSGQKRILWQSITFIRTA